MTYEPPRQDMATIARTLAEASTRELHRTLLALDWPNIRYTVRRENGQSVWEDDSGRLYVRCAYSIVPDPPWAYRWQAAGGPFMSQQAMFRALTFGTGNPQRELSEERP